jgi:hypothetical protein
LQDLLTFLLLQVVAAVAVLKVPVAAVAAVFEI